MHGKSNLSQTEGSALTAGENGSRDAGPAGQHSGESDDVEGDELWGKGWDCFRIAGNAT